MVRQPACPLALTWRLTGGFADGLIEGIHSLVQAAKVKARGYRSPRDLKAIIYLLAGKLDPWRPAREAVSTRPNQRGTEFWRRTGAR